ncbi:DUF4421 family protein [Mangrovibacterium lignilyticum]|uniref:DUF4421 family protein n=1 Tax=Mangrovibacterium lignilyticum TaxID=2668052 RepID=UPI0013D59B0B|nr:DUF4421 family protein [Mangrovibacterium lignilyticum]
MKKGIVLLVLIVAGRLLHAQSAPELSELNYDPNYVESYYDDLIVRLYSADKGNHAMITNGFNDLNLVYRSNDHFKLGAGVNYKWFGLKIGAELPVSYTDEDKYGQSSSFGLQSYLISRAFIVDVLALRTRGYYLSLNGKNASDLSSDGRLYQVRGDVQTDNLGANFTFVLNHNRFSYKAAFNQTDLQLRSAGSIIFGGSVGYYRIGGDVNLISDDLGEEYFPGFMGLYDFQSYSVYGSAGYAYSLVPFRRAILTGSASAQFGYRYNELGFSEGDSEIQSKPGIGASIRVAGGYHFSGFYLGATYIQNQFNSDINFNSLQISNGTSFLEFTLSKRFSL